MADEDIRRTFILLQHMFRMAVIQLVCCIAMWEVVRRKSRQKQICHGIREERERVRDELMKQIISSGRCRDIIRMSPRTFLNLCSILQEHSGLQPTQRATVEEQVAKFLYIIGHNVRSRAMSFFFRRSNETISRHFHSLLRGLIELEAIYTRQPDGSEVPPEITNNTRFYPYFKNCIGAIDGTHVRVKVSSSDAPRHRGRKEYPTQNILAACSFDLKFTYVLPGWEGTISDSRILKHALNRRYLLKIPEGKYDLLDAGVMLRGGLITPYRGERYHLKEYSRNPPQNPRELFNHRHSSLRNAIERAFGVLKKRFRILQTTTEPTYGINTQKQIVVACCILHNYLMGVDPDENIIAEVDHELANENYEQEREHGRHDNEDAARGELIRDSIAAAMWHDYIH